MSKVLSAFPIPLLSESDKDRFWKKVAFTADPDKCWNWTGSSRRRGYGRFCIQVAPNKDKSFVSTRVAYAITHGSCPIDKVIMHSCDNPSCVNPAHLIPGTNKENSQDMVSKNRQIGNFKDGEDHPLNKLTNENVLDIRNRWTRGEMQRSIAKDYGVNPSLISRIVRREYWSHI